MSDAHRALPPLLQQNPRLDQWVGFPGPERCAVATGRVEIGQGVLTAMRQIAAEELDVDPARIVLQTGDTGADPERGLHRGQPIDPVRRRRIAPGLRRGAGIVSRPRRGFVRLCRAPELAVRDGAILDPASRPDRITGRWPMGSI